VKINVYITPKNDVIADFLGTWNFQIEIASEEIKCNGGIRLYIPPGWTVPQLDRPADLGYTTVQVHSSKKVTLKKYIFNARWIIVEISNGCLLEGDLIKICYGDKSAGGPGVFAPRVAINKSVFEVSIDQKGNYIYEKIINSPFLKIIPGPPSEFKIVIPSYHQGKKIPIRIRAIDKSGNLSGGYIESIKYDINGFNSKSTSLVLKQEIVPKTVNLDRKTNGELLYFEAYDNSKNVLGQSNPSKQKDCLLLWGDLHGHSNLSDGCLSPNDYFAYAREISALDFVSLTDHDNVGGNSNVEEHSKLMTEKTWDLIKKATNKAYKPGEFVTLIGYEYTQIGLAYGGHRNVYFLDDNPPIFRSWDVETNTSTKLFKALRPFIGRALVIPHHPRLYMSREHDPELQRLFEIYSMWGGSEMPDDTCAFNSVSKYSPGGMSFIEALNYGYKMGVVAGGDNHDSVPGFTKATDLWRKGRMSRRPGLTAVLVKEKTREALFEALYNRRCYGTTGDRIILEFEIDGHLMGSEIVSDRPLIKAKAIGQKRIRKLHLIKNGLPIFVVNGPKEVVTLEYEDNYLKLPSSYYIRVEQEDGEKAWSSPIWVTPKN